MKSEDIKNKLEEHFNVNLSTKRGKHIISKVCFAYLKACKVLCKFETYSCFSSNIDKTHSSVNHALKRHDVLIESDVQYKDIWKETQKVLGIYKEPITGSSIYHLRPVIQLLKELPEDKVLEFQETRLKPYLKMNNISA